jgi:hypothetical protein
MRTEVLLPLLLGHALWLGSSGWLEVWIPTPDATMFAAHDPVSGAFVSETTSAFPELEITETASRVVKRWTDRVSDTSLEWLLLSDPAFPARAFKENLLEAGAKMSPGTWNAAFLESITPPPGCDHELVLVVRSPARRHPRVMRTSICSAVQEERATEYMRLRGGTPFQPETSSPPPAATVLPADKSKALSLAPGTSVSRVLSVFGAPYSMWRRWPDSLALVYFLDPKVEAGDLMLTFDKKQTLLDARVVGHEQ